MILDLFFKTVIKVTEPLVYKGGSMPLSKEESESVYEHNTRVIAENNALIAERKRKEKHDNTNR
jgi:hypothetical protein